MIRVPKMTVALYKREKSQKAGQESKQRCDLRRQQKMERGE